MKNKGIFGLLKLADIFTLLNAVSGIIVVYFSVIQQFNTAVIFLLLSVFLDYIDGKAATLMKSSTEFGKQLDSLADIVAFGAAPAAFVVAQQNTIPALAAASFFVVCGIIRLARYNIADFKKTFTGMPITLNGVIFPIVYLLGFQNYYPYVLAISGILMVSNLKIKKVL